MQDSVGDNDGNPADGGDTGGGSQLARIPAPKAPPGSGGTHVVTGSAA